MSLPWSFRFKRLQGQWAALVLAGALSGAAGFYWGWHEPKTSAGLEWKTWPAEAGMASGSDKIVTAHPRAAFAALVEELTSPGFLEGALRSVTPGWDAAELEAQRAAMSAEVGAEGLKIHFPRADEGAAPAQLSAIARQAQAALRRLVLVKAGPRDARLEAEVREARAKLQEFNRTNRVADVERALVTTQQQLADLGLKLALLNAEAQAAEARSRALSEDVGQQNPVLAATQAALQEALAQYTEAHPKVRELRAAIAKLESESKLQPPRQPVGLSLSANNAGATAQLQIIEQRAAAEALRRQCAALAETRAGLEHQLASLSAMRQVRTELEALVPAGATGEMAPSRAIGLPRVEIRRVPAWTRVKSGTIFATAGAMAGSLVLALGLVLGSARRGTIQNAGELEQAANLPTLAQLKDLRNMSRTEQERWALEAFSTLRGRLKNPRLDTLICGFTAMHRREGTSTCVELLAAAARRQDYVTVVLDFSRKTRKKTAAPKALPIADAEVLAAGNEPGAAAGEVAPADEAAPLLGACGNTQVVRLHNQELIWGWSFRQQLQEAVGRWNQTENMAVFVDLPPYSTKEGVALAGMVPNLVWCCRNGQSDFAETFALMKTLMTAQRNVLGTVFNEAKLAPRRKSRRWFKWPLAALLVCAGALHAQTPAPPPPELPPPPAVESAGLSVGDAAPLAPWQEHLTLGAGDIVDVAIYGKPDSARPGLVIGPDGCLTYLQARDIVAANLTVDQLREALEKALGKFYLSPKVVINPVAYNSKKYYLLGNVNRKGGYLLDRPTTVIEAIAKGGGFVSGLQNQNVASLVDLDRSFLIRRNDDGTFGKMAVNFEALFQRGDLSQNIALAPNDYLFFPDLSRQEIYVLGEVRAPGVLPYSKDMSVFGAIAGRGGFTERAWKAKILVLRGSINNPQRMIVDGADILKGRGQDFLLVNRDLVYVHSKPWAKPQEVAEAAITAFLSAAIVGYTGQHVGPFITKPIVR